MKFHLKLFFPYINKHYTIFQDTKQRKAMTNTMVIMRNMARRVDLSITRNGDTKNPNINHFLDKTKFSSILLLHFVLCTYMYTHTHTKLQQKPLIHFLTFITTSRENTYTHKCILEKFPCVFCVFLCI